MSFGSVAPDTKPLVGRAAMWILFGQDREIYSCGRGERVGGDQGFSGGGSGEFERNCAVGLFCGSGGGD